MRSRSVSSLGALVLGGVVVAHCAPQPTPAPRPSRSEVTVAEPEQPERPDVDAGIELPKTSDRERDIAWVKQRWPEETRDVKFESLASKLVSWVPERGELAAFLTVESHRCQPIVLRRAQTGEGAAELDGKIVLGERNVDGGRERTFTAVDPGHWLHIETGGGTERFDGREWIQESGWGVGDGGSTIAVLSHVDAEIARWEGVGVRLHAHCSGPVEPLACASGGSRPCDRCLDVALLIQEYRPGSSGGFGFGRSYHGPPPTCSEPCPRVSNDAIERVQKSQAFGDAWQLLVDDARLTPVPTLYRSESRCRRESRR